MENLLYTCFKGVLEVHGFYTPFFLFLITKKAPSKSPNLPPKWRSV